MTIQGAIAELRNLLEVDDVPFYYKSGIEEVIETIQMEMEDRSEPRSSQIIDAYTRGWSDGAKEVMKTIKELISDDSTC